MRASSLKCELAIIYDEPKLCMTRVGDIAKTRHYQEHEEVEKECWVLEVRDRYEERWRRPNTVDESMSLYMPQSMEPICI